MDLSIIIVSHNSRDFLAACLLALAACPPGRAWETIVVDNGSEDGTAALADRFPECRWVLNERNAGFARAANQGFELARGRFLLVLNPDVQVQPQSLEKMSRYMEDHPRAGLLLPRLLNPDGSLQFSCRRFYRFSTLLFRRTPLGKWFPEHRFLREHLMLDWDHAQPREVDWGLGACMLLRRAAFPAAEVFDPRFFLYFEDVDLCFRLKEAGWKVVYYPEAAMIHTHLRQSARGFFNRPRREHLKSLIKFWGKHGRLRPRNDTA